MSSLMNKNSKKPTSSRFFPDESERYGSISLDFMEEVYTALSESTKSCFNSYKKINGIPANAYNAILTACGFNLGKKYVKKKYLIRDNTHKMFAKNTLVLTGELREDCPNYMKVLYKKHDILKPLTMTDLDVLISDINVKGFNKLVGNT